MTHSAEPNNLAHEQMMLYVDARDNGHARYVLDAKRYDNYYAGDQWSAEDAAKLEKQGRPALTINEVLPTINTMLGEYTQRRADFSYKPAKDGTDETAIALTKLTQHITAKEHYDQKEALVVMDGFIQDRGWFDIRMDFSENILGEISITVDDPTDVIPDQDGRVYDPRSWKGLFYTRWLTLDEIELYYGKDKRDALEYLGVSGPSYGQDSVEMRSTFGDPDAEGFSTVAASRKVLRVRVIERQFKQLTMRKHFVDLDTGETKPVPDSWDEEKIKGFATQMELGIQRKLTERIRWRCTADNVVLHDEWSPYRTFTKVLYTPYFRRGKMFGVVRNLISPQDMLNKVSSQELHVVNTTANSGWTLEEGSLTNMDTNELEARGAETGLILEHRKGTEAPQKIQPNQIPTGLDRISVKASANMRRISGVNESMLGIDKAEVSGVAMQAKANRGFIQLEVPFDNLNQTRALVCAKILELLQDFYTEGRMYSITNAADPTQPSEELGINQMTPEGTIANDLTVGEYLVVMATQPARDTYDDSQFAEALQLREAGIMIPDDFIVRYSHLAKKNELAQEIRNLTGRGELTQEQMDQQALEVEMQMRRITAELASLDAKTESLQSAAALNMAKAQEIMAGEGMPAVEGAPPPIIDPNKQAQIAADKEAQLREIAATRANLFTELAAQVRIAQMNADVKRSATLATTVTNHAKMRHDAFNKKLDAETRTKIAASRPKPAKKK